MKYKIIEDSTANCWHRNDEVTIISVSDFNILINDNPKDILINLLKENEILSLFKCSYSTLKALADVIINNGDTNDIIDILNKNNVPYFSFYICAINTYRKRYKYLLELYTSKDIIISYNENSIEGAIKLAKYLKGNIILENTNIALTKYKDILNKYFLSDMNRSDISFYYQENNKPISMIELYNTSLIVDNIVSKVRSTNLSPIESIMYVYDNIKKRIYKKDEKNYHNSSDVNLVLTGDAIVCSGYSNVFNAILRCLDISAMPLISTTANHQRSIIYIRDEKYNIDGVYTFDPTWDRKKDKEDNNYINKYNYFAMPLSLSNKSAPDDFSRVLSLSFDEIIKCNENITNEKNIATIRTIDKIFEFILGKSFTDIETESFDSLSINKTIDKLNKAHTLVLSKIKTNFLEEKTFTKILYNTRKAELKSGVTSSLDITEIKKAVIRRYIKYKLLELTSHNLETNEISLKLLIYEMELGEILDRYFNIILFKDIPLNRELSKCKHKTLKKKIYHLDN